MSDKDTEGVPAVGFLVMAFTDEKAADQALEAMKKAKKERTFYFEDAAIIRQDTHGKVHYHETGDMKTSKGAGVGALIGGIVGMFGGPGGAALGASAGAAIGGAASHKDAGFRDESLKTVGLALKPGTSAVAAITSDDFLKAVQKQIPVEDIRRFVANLSTEISNKLDQGKSMALGLLLTEGGLAVKEVAADENSVEVIGLAVTDDALIAGGAVVTADELAYRIGGATAEGAFVEAGVVTKEGALIVDDVVDSEGEVLAVTALIPEEEAAESEDKPAEAGAAESEPDKT
jgi:uncharacterized membrane protein